VVAILDLIPWRADMKFMLLVYTDSALIDALPEGQMDGMLRTCFDHVDELHREGHLIESQMLDGPRTAKSVRIRNNRVTATDGPFSEAKEVLGGFNLIEARDMDEAVRIASQFPWARTGCIEVRPVQDLGAVRRRVRPADSPAA
jgi:hypothetical protein